MIEREITVEAGGHRLAATLCLPAAEGRFATVLMAHGSGPLDRDENLGGQRLDVFNTIAHRLAVGRFASLRYDKRGCGRSTGNYFAAGHTDLIDDLLTCFDALSALPECQPERLFLLGHSEGCLVAGAASLHRPAAAGLVLLCPFVEDTESVLLRQAAQMQREIDAAPGLGGALACLTVRFMGQPLAGQRRLIERVRATQATSFRVGLRRLPARWMRELLALDARALFAQVRCPLLVIGGDKDLQCLPGDVDRIAALVQGPVEAHRIADLTHVLRRDACEPTFGRTAGLLVNPVDPQVSELVAEWIGRQVGG
ncbi:MAG TPA: alpha/beta fold hydrolase [Candidatus Limnocylindrales bacterium]|nr:alpha/beta fold hydrolase [Candidatus Limnocylindrales bacterium]